MKHSTATFCTQFFVVTLFTALLLVHPAVAQTAATDSQPSATSAQTAGTEPEAVPSKPDRTHHSVAQNTADAWGILKTAATDRGNQEVRVQGITAIGTIPHSPIAHKLISDALSDSSIDVRISGIIAVGTLKDRALYGKLRAMLDDKEPAVIYTAAITLWKLNDKAGEGVLIAIAEGDRKTDAGLIRNSERQANKTLHSPSALASIAIHQGAGYFLGPFGIGITAWDYAHQHTGENPRVTVIALLSEEKTDKVHGVLLATLEDKDPQVRAAVARALGDYRDHATALSLLPTFNDDKLAVRLIGSASYIRASSGTFAAHVPAKP
jgi:HEAT repeat protein